MTKLLAVLLAALLLAVPAFAQTASLAGEWTMTKTVASGGGHVAGSLWPQHDDCP